MTDNLKNKIQKMPKIDLHYHVDGSFSPDFVKNTLNLPIDNSSLTAPPDCKSLTEYLTCFDLPIKCMQTKEDITAGIVDVLRQCANENVVYAELRFAPTCSMDMGLTYRDIFESAILGTKKGLKDYGIHSNLIACAMRHHSAADNLNMLEAAREFLNIGVCAIDLAGDENMFQNSEFAYLFERARALGMPFTIHSGECGSAGNVRLAVQYGAARIGHGIAVIKDTSLMNICKSSRIGFELCPTSNLQTRAVMPNELYPLRQMLDFGLTASVNTDNRTVSGTTLTDEYLLLCDKYGITENDLTTLYKNSVDMSFADDTLKNRLLSL